MMFSRLPALHQGEVRGHAFARMGEDVVGLNLVDQLDGGVAAVLRRDAGMGGAALDVDMIGGAALAPDGERVGRIARLEVELDVRLARPAA